MSENIRFEYKGREVTIITEGEASLLEEIVNYFEYQIANAREYIEDGDELLFTPLWSMVELNRGDEVSKLEDVLKEKDKFLNIVNGLFSNTEDFDKYLDKINIKKNGKFKKRSVGSVGIVTTATTFIYDYTNAWVTRELRLRAVDEDTVELVFDKVTCT